MILQSVPYPGDALPPGVHLVGRKGYDEPGNSGTVSVSVTDLTGGLAAAPSVGDFIVIAWACCTAGVDLAPTAPSGFTEIVNLWPNDTYEANLLVWWKFADAGDLSSITLPRGGAGDRSMAAHFYVYRGVDTGTPFDVTTTVASAVNSNDPDPPSITPATAGAKILVVGAAADANMTSFSNPGADLTDFFSNWRAGTIDITLGSGRKENWVSGAFNPSAWTAGAGSTGNSWSAASMAIRPA